MTGETWLQAGLALIGTVGGVVAARSARRTRGQERRDDFTTVTARMDRDIERLESRVERQEAETLEQQRQIAEYDALVRWMARWFRACVSVMRESRLDIPGRPQPEPSRANEYLHDIDM